jgi:hypothetical protein
VSYRATPDSSHEVSIPRISMHPSLAPAVLPKALKLDIIQVFQRKSGTT